MYFSTFSNIVRALWVTRAQTLSNFFYNQQLLITQGTTRTSGCMRSETLGRNPQRREHLWIIAVKMSQHCGWHLREVKEHKIISELSLNTSLCKLIQIYEVEQSLQDIPPSLSSSSAPVSSPSSVWRPLRSVFRNHKHTVSGKKCPHEHDEWIQSKQIRMCTFMMCPQPHSPPSLSSF